MKKMILILIIGIVFISSCAKQKISFVIEDLNNKNFDDGIYYEYKYSDEELKEIKNIDAELILNDLIQNNVKITNAWYKRYATSCCPPDTNRCMQAIVEPVFIIKLEEETELDNFIKINKPKIGWCAYEVKHYTIQ